MLKVVIIDDEALIRRGLQEIIDWGGLGFRIAGEAEDGELGLELIRSEQPDVVVTDIKMPFMDGLEMITACCREDIKTRYLILSGYDEFDYAREAMKNGVKHYLLKPVDQEELIRVLLQIKEEVQSEEQNKQYLQTLEQKLQENYAVLREKFIYELVAEKLSFQQVLEKDLEYYNIKFDNRYFEIILFEADGLSEDTISVESCERERQKTRLIISDTAAKVFIRHQLPFVSSGFEDAVVFVLNTTGPEEIGRGALEEISAMIRKVACISISIGVSSTAVGINKLPALYRQAQAALKYKLFEGDGSILYYSDMDNNYKAKYFFPYDKAKLLIFSVIDCDKEKASVILDSIMAEINSRTDLSPHHIYRMCTEILFNLRKALDEVGVNMEEIEKEDVLSAQIIASKRTLEELRSWMNRIVSNAIAYLQNRLTNTTNENIDRIILFIRSNYAEDITLEAISKKFFIEPTYFSKLFKKATGQTYLNYLTEIRVQRACELLKNPDTKVYEVAGKVGYEDQRYFSQIFRKYTQLTPSEYRNKGV